MVDIQRDNTMQKLVAMTEENNRILKKMRRSQKVSSFFRFLYWIIILGALFGSYYFIQPYLTQLLEVYQNLIGTSDILQGVGQQIPGADEIGDILGGLGAE